jgi:hypothetical protein
MYVRDLPARLPAPLDVRMRRRATACLGGVDALHPREHDFSFIVKTAEPLDLRLRPSCV